jgi:hypothetical protein
MKLTMRAMVSICFAGLLALIESGCGGVTYTAPPPPALSISTTSLIDGMVSFPYSQTILTTEEVRFPWEHRYLFKAHMDLIGNGFKCLHPDP